MSAVPMDLEDLLQQCRQPSLRMVLRDCLSSTDPSALHQAYGNAWALALNDTDISYDAVEFLRRRFESTEPPPQDPWEYQRD